MKRLLIILGLFITTLCFSQGSVFQIEEIYHGKNYREMKKLRKRFDKAAIYKEFFYYDGWYMELEEDDKEEYYKRFGIKFYCIPRQKRDKIELMVVFYDTIWNDNSECF